MTRITIPGKILLAAVVAALALTAGTASADDGLGLAAQAGCSVQCVEKAAVSATASSARVDIQTAVKAFVDVTVAQQAAGGGDALTLPRPAKTVHAYVVPGPAHAVSFFDLQPDTTYTISLKATDFQGRSWRRSGTFHTLQVKRNGAVGGPATIDSGLGCAAQCITRARFSQAPPDGSVASLDVTTAVDAKVKVAVARDAEFFQLVASQSSPGYVRSWHTQVGGLLPGTTYHVVMRATDRQGRVLDRKGTFRTVPATALVTIQKIKVVADGDKGSAKGELYFRYTFGGVELANYGFVKLGSGSLITAKSNSTSRPTVGYRFAANGDAKLDVRVTAEECDGPALMRNCVVEQDPVDQYTVAGGLFDLSDLLSGALPGWYGTGVAQSAGHDGYFVFGSPAGDYVKILVFATVDLDYEWPS
ncbi:MAG TPA: hypothetical protein VFB35_03660 [Gaiellaceae bacterium]|nr:hypothetical protein [Gaiellaceae bacterium]